MKGEVSGYLRPPNVVVALVGRARRISMLMPTASWMLLKMASLPLFDGYFIAFLASGTEHGLWGAIGFGTSAFSGPGCMVAASQLRGPLWARVGQMLIVYLVLSLGVVIGVLLLPILLALMPSDMSFFTGFVVFSVALRTLYGNLSEDTHDASWQKADRLQRLAKSIHDNMGGRFAVKVLGWATLVHVAANLGNIPWNLDIPGHMFEPSLISVASGLAYTLIGLAIGAVSNDPAGETWLRRSGCIALSLLALRIFKIAIPGELVPVPLIAFVLWSLWRRIKVALR